MASECVAAVCVEEAGREQGTRASERGAVGCGHLREWCAGGSRETRAAVDCEARDEDRRRPLGAWLGAWEKDEWEGYSEKERVSTLAKKRKIKGNTHKDRIMLVAKQDVDTRLIPVRASSPSCCTQESLSSGTAHALATRASSSPSPSPGYPSLCPIPPFLRPPATTICIAAAALQS